MNKTGKLGHKVKDIVTGFTGIITAEADYLSGEKTVQVTPPLDSEGKYQRPEWFDVSMIAYVDKGLQE